MDLHRSPTNELVYKEAVVIDIWTLGQALVRIFFNSSRRDRSDTSKQDCITVEYLNLPYQHSINGMIVPIFQYQCLGMNIQLT